MSWAGNGSLLLWLEPAPDQRLCKEPPLLCLLHLCSTSVQLQWQTATKTPHIFCLKPNWTFQVSLRQMRRINSASQTTFGGISCIAICKYFLKTWCFSLAISIHLSPSEGGTNHFPLPLFRQLFSTQKLWFCHNILSGVHANLHAHSIPDPSNLSFSVFLCVTSHLAVLKCFSGFFFKLHPCPIHIGLFANLTSFSQWSAVIFVFISKLPKVPNRVC